MLNMGISDKLTNAISPSDIIIHSWFDIVKLALQTLFILLPKRSTIPSILSTSSQLIRPTLSV